MDGYIEVRIFPEGSEPIEFRAWHQGIEFIKFRTDRGGPMDWPTCYLHPSFQYDDPIPDELLRRIGPARISVSHKDRIILDGELTGHTIAWKRYSYQPDSVMLIVDPIRNPR